MRRVGGTFGQAVSLLLVTLSVAACSGNDDNAAIDTVTEPDVPESVASVTLDEVGCTYKGDKTPEAPFFYMDTNNLVSSYGFFEVDRIPANVTNDEVEAFFEDAQVKLEQGGVFRGVPAEWRLNRRTGQQPGTSGGGMLVGDPIFEDQGLVAGQRYVVWCSTGDPPTGKPPTALFFAAVFEATE